MTNNFYTVREIVLKRSPKTPATGLSSRSVCLVCAYRSGTVSSETGVYRVTSCPVFNTLRMPGGVAKVNYSLVLTRWGNTW